MSEPVNESHKRALQALAIAEECLGQGNRELAEKVYQDARDHYIDAGLNPAWFVLSGPIRSVQEIPDDVHAYLLGQGKIELSTDPDPKAPVRGIVAEPSDLERVER